MSEKDHEDFNDYIKYSTCKRAYEESEVKVKDYNHITEKYRKSSHQECNLNLTVTTKILFVFHNLPNYDSHFIFQEIEKYNFKTNFIPKTRK